MTRPGGSGRAPRTRGQGEASGGLRAETYGEIGGGNESGSLVSVAATGIGLDLLEIERMARALERRPALAQRLFRPGELEYAWSRAQAAQHLAARFCAKEAVSKALGLRVFVPHDVEVVGGGAAVGLALHGAALARAEELGVEVDVSMTHTRGMAAAVAVLR